MDKLRDIGTGVRRFVLDDSNKISKAASRFILDRVAEYEDILIRVLFESERIKGKNEELCARVRDGVKEAREAREVRETNRVTYAGAVAAPPRPGEGFPGARVEPAPVPARHAVVVKARQDGVTADQVRKKILEVVRPEVNIRVRAVRKTRTNGVAIETVSAAELERLKACPKFAEVGLVVEAPKGLLPKVVLYDVPSSMTEGQLMDELFAKNASMWMEREDFDRCVNVRSRSKNEGGVGNLVLEVAARLRDRWVREGRVYVGWLAFKVRGLDDVTRCYRCQEYGHVAARCKLSPNLERCRACNRGGHKERDCKEEKPAPCKNCENMGFSIGLHSMRSADCPAYKVELERVRVRQS